MPAPSVGLTPEGRMDFWFKPFERLRPGQGAGRETTAREYFEVPAGRSILFIFPSGPRVLS